MLGMELMQLRGDCKSIHQQTLAPSTVVVEQMKQLKTGISNWSVSAEFVGNLPHRIRKVRRVRVSTDGHARVRCVAVSQVGVDVPESTIVRFADKCDSPSQFFCSVRGGWNTRHH